MSSPTASEPRLAGPPETAPCVIAVENVTVRYRLPRERISSVKAYTIQRLKGQLRYDDFWALRELSFEIRKGETIGIIGNNGAGKSTLLKLVAGVLRPTNGRVWVKGRVAPLLELGAGFDHELTGRENVFLNGTILGFRESDVLRRFDRIVDFAGVREFIDMPVRNYSTGMIARLGFAIATDVQPDVLIIDELLSVGDQDFRRKSNERIAELRRHGDAVLLVTHDVGIVSTQCHRAVWLEHGRLRMMGPAADVVAAYLQETRR